MLIDSILKEKGHEVAKVLATAPVSTALRELSSRRIGALVVEDRWMKMVGIFSERDLVNALAKEGPSALSFEVRRLMTAPVVTCRAADRVDDMMAMMTMRRIRHLPVVDDNGLVGIVSIGDLVKHRLVEKEQEADMLLDLTRMRS